MASIVHKYRKWRTNRTLKKSKQAQFCDMYLRRLMLKYNSFYLSKSDHEEIKNAIKETENVKNSRLRLTELLCFHGLVIRNGENSPYREETIARTCDGLKKYHAMILLEAYIELMSRARVKKLYRFHNSKNVLKQYHDRQRAHSMPVQITV